MAYLGHNLEDTSKWEIQCQGAEQINIRQEKCKHRLHR